MSRQSFKQFLSEEMTSGEIADVESKLEVSRMKHLDKGKKCKKHKRANCEICQDLEDSKYN